MAGRTGTRLRRVLNLYLGLLLFGGGLGLMFQAELGLNPWDVLHQGLAGSTGLPLAWVVIGVSTVVLALWIPLRQRPGFGTVHNVLLIGPIMATVIEWVPAPEQLPVRVGFLLAGLVINAVGTAMYLGAGLGPGPRDGLMTGLAARGVPVRRARTLIEVAALAVGWSLGGTVGVGTVVFALAIGPLVHFFVPRLRVPPATPAPNPAPERTPSRLPGWLTRGTVGEPSGPVRHAPAGEPV
ncbi:hypothetical protein C1701_03070 [Actinoalloteichus sp. AHMU CJ021]|uniref:membrane protein YczE n=1 Tax=Actinoalloteichus sp. AHMU CJ021 TaxID=2072503 RepID=UPI000CA073DF|nr:hypothetical protein C1701_03070 [Actinoalloteichus sp. AHMU CJ021]